MKLLIGISVFLLTVIDSQVFSLPCNSIGYHRHPTDCSKFYYCYGTSYSCHYPTQHCPAGLLFNTNLNVCDWPRNVDCVDATTTTLKTKTPSRAETTPPLKTSQVASLAAKMTPPSKTTRAPTSGYKRVCYYTNWSNYRSGIGMYNADNIDTSLCTHIIYAFAVLNPITFALKMHDPNVDQDGYLRVTAKKSSNVKVLLAVGGWRDSATCKYSDMVSSKEHRTSFINSAVKVLKQYNFDGLDLDWEYPKCWQGRCHEGPASDKQNFAIFVQELREAFDKESPPLMLTSVLAADSNLAKQAYDIPSLSRNVDFFNVMTYDYHGPWDSKTGHHAPLYAMPGDDNPRFNIDYTIRYYLDAGAPASKLVVGIASYGKSFTLANPNDNGFNAPATGGGAAGEFTKMSGTLAFYEICKHIKDDGWTKVAGNKTVGPYAYKGNQWVGYLDVDTVAEIAEYLKSNKLGGAMYWSLDFDDFTGSCCSTKSPLFTTVKKVFTGIGPSVDKIKSGCPKVRYSEIETR